MAELKLRRKDLAELPSERSQEEDVAMGQLVEELMLKVL